MKGELEVIVVETKRELGKGNNEKKNEKREIIKERGRRGRTKMRATESEWKTVS